MARQIDLDNLDREDLEYLAQRDQMVREAEVMGHTNLRERIRNRHELDQEAASEDTEEETTSYREWTNAQLKAELAERGLEESGTKAQLVERLEADDEEEEEEE